MKKLSLTIVLLLTMCLGASAQYDGYFRDSESGYRDDNSYPGDGYNLPLVPNSRPGEQPNMDAAPLGSGLLILTALGAGYAIARRKSR